MSSLESGNDPDKKLGKWMFIIAWIIGLGLLTLVFDEQIARQINPNQDPHSMRSGDVIEVRLKQNRKGHYVSGGLINGEPVTFLLDTGATDVSIPAHLASRLGLKPGFRQQAITANGIVTVANTNIATLQLGDIVLNNVDANLNPGMQGEQILLGMSALKHLEFAQKDGWLLLRSL